MNNLIGLLVVLILVIIYIHVGGKRLKEQRDILTKKFISRLDEYEDIDDIREKYIFYYNNLDKKTKEQISMDFLWDDIIKKL